MLLGCAQLGLLGLASCSLIVWDFRWHSLEGRTMRGISLHQDHQQTARKMKRVKENLATSLKLEPFKHVEWDTKSFRLSLEA